MKFKLFLTIFAQLGLPILVIAGLVYVMGPNGVALSIVLGVIYLMCLVGWYSN